MTVNLDPNLNNYGGATAVDFGSLSGTAGMAGAGMTTVGDGNSSGGGSFPINQTIAPGSQNLSSQQQGPSQSTHGHHHHSHHHHGHHHSSNLLEVPAQTHGHGHHHHHHGHGHHHHGHHHHHSGHHHGGSVRRAGDGPVLLGPSLIFVALVVLFIRVSGPAVNAKAKN